MRRPTFFILSALAEQPRHGYGVILRVGELSDGAVRLGPGTLYGALDRLQEQGLIVLDREEVEAGRQRRYYRLSDAGRDAVAAELARLQRDVEVGRTALGGVG
jgi:DNA-binding PadR family transcriptional regulator